MNVGILTAGGMCPGVNEVIHSIGQYEKSQGNRIIGFKDGFHGLNMNQKVNISIHQMNQSCEKVDVDMAVKNMKYIDRLYCICGNESMNDAYKLAMDDRIHTNVIGIAKSIYNDIPGLECLGFRSAIVELAQLVDTVYFEASTSRSVYFLIVPGLQSDDLINHLGYAKQRKISAIITPMNNNSITVNILKSFYETHSFAVVLISEKCNYMDIFSKMGDIRTTVINPGNQMKEVDTCLYDTILSNTMARESFLYAQENKNFIKGASNIIKFEDYINIV